MPAQPCSTAATASSGVITPFSSTGKPVVLRMNSTSSQSRSRLIGFAAVAAVLSGKISGGERRDEAIAAICFAIACHDGVNRQDDGGVARGLGAAENFGGLAAVGGQIDLKPFRAGTRLRDFLESLCGERRRAIERAGGVGAFRRADFGGCVRHGVRGHGGNHHRHGELRAEKRGRAVGVLIAAEIMRRDGDALECRFVFALRPFVAGGAGDVAEAARRNHFLRRGLEFAEIDELDGFDFRGRGVAGTRRRVRRCAVQLAPRLDAGAARRRSRMSPEDRPKESPPQQWRTENPGACDPSHLLPPAHGIARSAETQIDAADHNTKNARGFLRRNGTRVVGF